MIGKAKNPMNELSVREMTNLTEQELSEMMIEASQVIQDEGINSAQGISASLIIENVLYTLRNCNYEGSEA